VGGGGSDSDTDPENDSRNYQKHRINIKAIKNKTTLFNPNNKDHKCFLRCIFFLMKIGKIKKDFFKMGKISRFKRNHISHHHQRN